MATLERPLPRVGLGRLGLRIPRWNWWLTAATVTFLLGAALPVLQSSVTTSRGFEIRSLEQRRQELQAEIALLQSEIAEEGSLERVRERAAALGLRPAENPLFVTVDVPGPVPAQVPARYLPEATPVAERPEPWWQSLLRWLPFPD